jgi:phospholysine phosphohistidine inorganic pyrophosphate phosphatase
MRGILLDLDGVLYDSETAIDGAAEAVLWIRSRNIPHLFVTNTTSRGRAALVEKLHRFGIPADSSQILTPCAAAAEWLKKHAEGPAALFVNPKALAEFEQVDRLPEEAEAGARYVVIGDLGDAWNFHTLNRAFRLLHSNPESVLIALGMTRFWHAHDGIRLDAAPFVAALERATGRNPLVLGKPAEPFFRAAADRLGLRASEIVMFGDDIETDIAGAQRAGLQGVLLRTGKFRESDLLSPVKPDAVLHSIRDLPAWWKQTFMDP